MPINIHAHFFRQVIVICKAGHTNLFLARDQGSLVGLCTQDYKSVRAAVMICSTLVNIQTHTYSISTILYEKVSQMS